MTLPEGASAIERVSVTPINAIGVQRGPAIGYAGTFISHLWLHKARVCVGHIQNAFLRCLCDS